VKIIFLRTAIRNLAKEGGFSEALFQEEVLGSMKNSDSQPDFEEYRWKCSRFKRKTRKWAVIVTSPFE
jgi:hypothetical protein